MKKTISTTLLLLFAALASTAYAQEKTTVPYGKNLLAITPIGLTDRGVSVGLTYERALDEKGILHFSLPVFYTFSNADNAYKETKAPSMVYAYPGFKIYPTGAYGMVRYGIGPSLVIAGGKTYNYNYTYEPNTGNYVSVLESQDRFLFGIMVTNSLNINFNRKFYLGTELGLGLTYVNTLNGERDGTNGLARLGFSFGYRF